MMLPKSAPTFPNIEPIDTAIPLEITDYYKFRTVNILCQSEVHLYSVGNISTAMQYIRLIPTLERASNIDDRTRFSIEDVMKYKQAADMPDPKKLTTKWNKHLIMLIVN